MLATWGFCLRAALGATAITAVAWIASAAAPAPKPSDLLGVWRGTSTCTDRVAAPACNDEVVVYEFTAGATPGTVNWKADKIVNGERLPMGELELAYSADDACWRGEFPNTRVRGVWCLAADHGHMTGRAWLLPGKQIVRKVDLRKD